MFKLLIVCVLYSAYLTLDVEAHGRMMDPPNRASVWRLPEGKDFPVAEFDAEWCDYDDPNDLRDKRNSSCGVCGPVYNGDPRAVKSQYKHKHGVYTNLTSYERESTMYKGDIVRTYNKGQWVTAKIKIVANHAGSVQFRVCQVTDLNKDPTMDCFEQNILKFENGQEKFPLKKAVKTDEKVYNKNYEYVRSERWHNFKVKLPDNLECAHCLFQMKWFETDTQQVYFGCSDVAIVA